jgi:CubicO group peptidase (beta-lactamase class C family)
METSINLGDKFQEYENVNYAVLRVLVASLDGYNDWVNNPGANTAARFINYVNESIFNPLGIYDVKYTPDAIAPTLFYPNPAGSAHGTAYGDWSLRPGSAGVHTSVHELAVFGAALFNGLLTSASALNTMKTNGLGLWDYGVLPDGSQCLGHNGYFPASWNGGAELSSVLISCSNGVSGMLLLNGEVSSGSKFMDALKAAFIPQ